MHYFWSKDLAQCSLCWVWSDLETQNVVFCDKADQITCIYSFDKSEIQGHLHVCACLLLGQKKKNSHVFHCLFNMFKLSIIDIF